RRVLGAQYEGVLVRQDEGAVGGTKIALAHVRGGVGYGLGPKGDWHRVTAHPTGGIFSNYIIYTIYGNHQSWVCADYGCRVTRLIPGKGERCRKARIQNYGAAHTGGSRNYNKQLFI